MYDFNYIRNLEAQGKWKEAEQAWSRTEFKEHAKACKLLVDAIEAGDAMREQDKQTVYTVLEGIRGNFFYRQGDYTIKAGERLVGYVYGIGEATEAVVALSDNKDELKRVVTGIKLDFPDLNN